MKRVGYPLLVAAAILLLANCSGRATVCKSFFHETVNHTCVCSFPVEGEYDLATLYFQSSLESGAITYTLRDPDGNVRWEEHLESRNGLERTLNREFSTPAAGDWRLELFLQDAVGEYCGIWKTQ
jgi:hypothetical protein